MTIYVVQPGDTLYAIAREQGIAPGLIARFNGLRPPYTLAVGQGLLILQPAELYTVRPGDTLEAVSRTTGRSILQLLRDNPNLGGRVALYPGQVLVLGFDEPPPTRPVRVTGYAYPFVDMTILQGILPYATEAAPFTYGITPTGGLVALDDGAILRAARLYGVLPMLHLSTLTEGGIFSSALAQSILSSQTLQENLVQAVVDTAVAKDYYGVDLDFEFVTGQYAAAYAEFADRLRQALAPYGKPLMVALAPKTSDDQPGALYEGHDYALLGQAADWLLLMTYEWGYTYGPPMAVAPLRSVRRVLDYAVSRVPPEKVYLGFPNYGYDWLLPYNAGASRATSISHEFATELAVRKNAEIRFDETAQSPWFFYTGEDGEPHEVWFEDARSTQKKLALVEEYNFAGVGFWNFMRPFATGFSVLHTMYRIETALPPET